MLDAAAAAAAGVTTWEESAQGSPHAYASHPEAVLEPGLTLDQSAQGLVVRRKRRRARLPLRYCRIVLKDHWQGLEVVVLVQLLALVQALP